MCGPATIPVGWQLQKALDDEMPCAEAMEITALTARALDLLVRQRDGLDTRRLTALAGTTKTWLTPGLAPAALAPPRQTHRTLDWALACTC